LQVSGSSLLTTSILFIIFDLTVMSSLTSPISGRESNQSDNASNDINQMTAGLKEIKNNTTNNSSNYQRQGIVDNESIAATQLNSLSPIASTILFNDNSSCLAYDRINRTISLCGGSMDLSAINQIINSSDVLNNTSDKNWILNANISIENGAKLFINSTDTDWLRINSTGNRPYSIIVYGSLLIDRTKISSWNSTSNSEVVLSAASDN
jgi:hypothetical protein